MGEEGGGGDKDKWPNQLMVLPLHVWAQECDSQQKVHHDGAHHHGQSQENGPVLSCFQCCDSFPFVQEVVVPDFLVNISEVENNKVLYEIYSYQRVGKSLPMPY